MTTDRPLLAVISGPTAVGKTCMAISVARHFGTEIISADSRQFYREMSIGTAVPSHEQRAAIPHHFIHHLSVEDTYNISRFESDALTVADRLFREHPLVVLTGGSGLYIDAVCRGIDELPDPDPALRLELETLAATRGTSALAAILEKLDPVYAARVDAANPVRLIRAIEVCRLTGVPYSSLRTRTRRDRPFRICKIGLRLPMEELTRRINARTDAMLGEGWVEEALALFPRRHLNALSTVGYRELFNYMEGLSSLEQAVEKIRINTRRYAKRQMTWFERDGEYTWFHPACEEEVIRFLSQAL